MAFDTTPDCSDVLKRLKELAKASKNYLTGQRGLMVAATCDAQIPLSVIQHLGQVNALMTAQVALVGAAVLSAYARQVTGSSTYDPVAEFTNTKNAMANAQATLTSMFPKDASNFILFQTIQADGSILNRTFTAAQLASAVSTIDSVIATIN